jgi:hypothetical protein
LKKLVEAIGKRKLEVTPAESLRVLPARHGYRSEKTVAPDSNADTVSRHFPSAFELQGLTEHRQPASNRAAAGVP